jgi:hypothetical protein
MILRHPTGLYQDAGQLPSNPSDVGNVTFVISNDVPKRSNALFIQLPVSEETRPAPTPIYDDVTRREGYGELVYTLVESNRSDPGTNRKLFGIGEFLEFDTEDIVLPDLLGVPRQVDLQHNTNVLDYADAGLTTAEIDSIVVSATLKKKELENQVAELQVQVDNESTAAIENQKRINETRKLISAVSQIVDTNNTILKKLQARESDLLIERDTIMALINEFNTQLKVAYDQLVKISELVH